MTAQEIRVMAQKAELIKLGFDWPTDDISQATKKEQLDDFEIEIKRFHDEIAEFEATGKYK